MAFSAFSSSNSSTFTSSFASPEHFTTSSTSTPFDASDPSWRKELPPLPPMNIVAVSDFLNLKREESILQLKSPFPFQILSQTSNTATTSDTVFNPLFLTRRQSSNVVTPGSIDSINYSPHSSSSTVASPAFSSPHLLLQQSSPSSDDQSVTEGEADDEPPFQLQLQTEHTPDTTNSSASSTVEDTPNSTTTPSPLNFDNSPTLLPMNGMNVGETAEGVPADDVDVDRKPLNGFSLQSNNISQAASNSFSLSSSSSSFLPSISSSSADFSLSSLSQSISSSANRGAYVASAHLSYNFHSIKSLPTPSPILFAVQISASRNHKILENKAGTQFMLKEDQKSKRWPRKYLSVWPTAETALAWVAFCLSEWPELRFVLGPPGNEIRLIVVEDTDAKLHHEVYSLVHSELEVETAVRGVRKKRHESRYATARIRLIHLIPTTICSPNDEGVPLNTLITPNELMSGTASQGQPTAQASGRRRQRNAADASTSSSTGKRGAYGVKLERETEGEGEEGRSEEPRATGAKRKKPRNSLVADSMIPSANQSSLSDELQRILSAASSDLPPAKIENELQLHSAMSAESQAQLSGLQSLDSTESANAAAIVPPMPPIPPLPMNRTASLSFSAFASQNSLPVSSFGAMPLSTANSMPAFTSTSANAPTTMSWASSSSSSSISATTSSASVDFQPMSPMTSQHSAGSHSAAAIAMNSGIGGWPQLHLPLPSLPPLMTAGSAVNALPTLTPNTLHAESRDCMMPSGAEDEDIRSFGFALPLPSAAPVLSQQNSLTNSLPNNFSYQALNFQWNTAALDYSFSEGADGERSIYPTPESKTAQTDTKPSISTQPTVKQASRPAELAQPNPKTTVPIVAPLPSMCSVPCTCCRELKEAALLSELHSVLLAHCTLSAALIGRFLRESVDDISCVEDLIEFWDTAGAARLCKQAAFTEIQVAKIGSCRKKLLHANAYKLHSMLQQCKVPAVRQIAIAKSIDLYHSEHATQNAAIKGNDFKPEAKAETVRPVLNEECHLSLSPKSSKQMPPLAVHRARSMSLPAFRAPTVSRAESSSSSSAKREKVKVDQARSSFAQCPPTMNGLGAQRRLWQRWADCFRSVHQTHGPQRDKNVRKASHTVEIDFVFEVLSEFSSCRAAPLCDVRSIPLPLRLSLADLVDSDYYQLTKRAIELMDKRQSHISANKSNAKLLILSLLALNHISRRWRSARQSEQSNSFRVTEEGKNAFSAIVDHCSTGWCAGSEEAKQSADAIWQCINFQRLRISSDRMDVTIRISGARQLMARFCYLYSTRKS